MQTFLPISCFDLSAQCLDYRRLGKQRVECVQLLKAISGQKTGWSNHPAAKMWDGYSVALGVYLNEMIAEWVKRGYQNTIPVQPVSYPYSMPDWFGDEAFHAAHRSNLLRKDPVHYGQFGWTETNDLPYVWPVGAR